MVRSHPRYARVSAVEVFLATDQAIRAGKLIRRVGRRDKEFHFQDWFGRRVNEAGVRYDAPARNSYPDFCVVDVPEGYEVKGLAFPGREANFDSNSQAPSGHHNGRTIYYFFGRYPKDPGGNEYPVIDVAMCHGDFLNADHDYVHENKHVRAFGTYGDIMIRDRKMYVVPTPFALTTGTTGQRTLILPAGVPPDPRLQAVGRLVRVECPELVTGYAFDLRTNELAPTRIPNPNRGAAHAFTAYRVLGQEGDGVAMR